MSCHYSVDMYWLAHQGIDAEFTFKKVAVFLHNMDLFSWILSFACAATHLEATHLYALSI